MKGKLFNLPEARNKVHLEPFDFSQNRMQTFQPGMIHVLQCIEVNPHEKFRFNVSSLTRTIPLNSAAIVRAKEHFNFHFVPTRLLWRYFQDFIIQNSHADSSSSVTDASVPSVVPTMNMREFVSELVELHLDSSARKNDMFGFDKTYTINKLAQELGYGYINLDDSNNQVPDNVSLLVNILPWCAYQKVYQDFYRNTQWESYDATSFNVDYLNNVGSSLDANKLTLDFDPSSPSNNLSIFEPRYANYKKDYFFGIRPNSQFGDVSVVSVSTSEGSYIDGTNLPARTYVTLNEAGVIEANNVQLSLKGTFDILSLRKAEAIQRLREIQQAGDFRYKGQISRRFGFEVPDSRAQMAEYIGGFDNVLNITDVTSTASTEDQQGALLGQLGGKGTFVSSGDKTIDYETKEHGYILCTYYISNEVNYNAMGIFRQNQHLTFEDYFQPEFQNIGLSTVNKGELWFDVFNSGNFSEVNAPLGYQPRYLEYKVQPDLLLDEFMSGGSFAYWTTPLSSSQQLKPFEDDDTVDFRWFKIPPTAFDSIMSMYFSEDLKQNPFLSTMYFDIKALRPMSVDGMPDWHNS